MLQYAIGRAWVAPRLSKEWQIVASGGHKCSLTWLRILAARRPSGRAKRPVTRPRPEVLLGACNARGIGERVAQDRLSLWLEVLGAG